MADKNRGGRPREGDEIKLAPLNMRTSPELRDKIEESADRFGRSLTQEVERRLISSFFWEDQMGGPHVQAFVHMLGAVIHNIEVRRGAKWTDDQDTWFAVEAAALRLLAWDRPHTDEDDKREKAGMRMVAAFQKHDEARNALGVFYERQGLPPEPFEALDPTPVRGMFGGTRWHDPREGWTDEQKQEEQALLAAERKAADAAAKAGNAYRKLTQQLDEKRKAAGETGQEVAHDFFRLVGPRPKRQAERAI